MPRSPWTAIVLGSPGQTLVVAWMTPRAPLAKRTQATAVSSTSMRSWASVALKALTCVARPIIHNENMLAAMWINPACRKP